MKENLRENTDNSDKIARQGYPPFLDSKNWNFLEDIGVTDRGETAVIHRPEQNIRVKQKINSFIEDRRLSNLSRSYLHR